MPLINIKLLRQYFKDKMKFSEEEIQKYMAMLLLKILIMVAVFWKDYNNFKLNLEIQLEICIKTINLIIIKWLILLEHK